MSDDSPKIFVDEDWKARVHREREEAARKAEEAERQRQAAATAPPAGGVPVTPLSADGGGASPSQEAGDEALLPEDEGPLEANFATLVASLTTQAMFALGMIPQPGQDQLYVNLDQAAFTLETLAMLAEKTKGNLTPEEESYLAQALTELERVFQARILQFQQQSMPGGGVDPNQLR